MESLPSDIIQDILSRVPAESVLECKLVCKQWVTLIRGSSFANMHLSNMLNHLHDGSDNLTAKVEPGLFFACRIYDPDVYRSLLFHGGHLIDRISNNEKFIYNQNLTRVYHPRMHHISSHIHLVGSCNGLVCAFQHHHLIIDPVYIFNPLTREYVHLPQLVVKEEDVDPEFFTITGGEVDMHNDIACGFGYVSSTNQYKVVRIHYLDYEVGIVEVYTLGSDCGWRAIGELPYRMDMVRNGTGTYLNDAIYWTSYDIIVAFDLAKEEFWLLPIPPCLQNLHDLDYYGLVALGNHLCLYIEKLHMEMWYLMESRDSTETYWRMECDIDYHPVVGARERNFQPILLSKNGEIIFLHDDSVLYSYDTKTTFLKIVSNETSIDNFEVVEAIAHVNTFVSSEAMGENSKRYTVRPCCVHTPLDDVIHELGRVTLGEEIDTTPFRLRRS